MPCRSPSTARTSRPQLAGDSQVESGGGLANPTVHGFRSTFRDWCAESVANAFPREVCEHALAHSLPDKVEAAYRRGDLIEKRVLLMKAWADYCAKPATEGVAAVVTPIRGKGARKAKTA